MHQRCPNCRAPIPERAARCPICGGDPKAAPPSEATRAPLAPHYAPPTAAPRPALAVWWRAAGALALVVGVVLALGGLGALLSAAGLSAIGWPAVAGLAGALAAGALVLLERQRARRMAATTSASSTEGSAAGDLALMYLHADHYAAPADGRMALRAPLTRTHVNADDLAWRGVAATLTALADGAFVEMEEHALATPAGPVQAVAVRLVRPLPPGEAFAAKLLRSLVRRGVGGSTTVGEAVGQLVMARRRPATGVLALAREQALARGYLRLPGTARGTPGAVLRGWLAAALLLPPQVDPAHRAEPDPALAALDERLAVWDERDPALVAALRAEVRAAFLRERARAGHSAS